MSFALPIISDDEWNKLLEQDLLLEGIYSFRVVTANECYSKAGNPQIKLSLQITTPGRVIRVFDYLVGSNTAQSASKIRSFCVSTGLQQSSLTAGDCLDQEGKVKIYIQKDDKGEHPPKNAVAKYVDSKQALTGDLSSKKYETNASSPEEEAPFNDDIPF